MKEEKPVEIAVIGGGCASMAAAFELSRPEHRGRYRITVYQQGWRLGGKGASGRGPAGRIEEHGLHIWMGFYENAFRLMRECYAELDRPAGHPMASWRDAFVPSHEVGVAEEEDGGWASWTSSFPAAPGLPGDPLTEQNPFTVAGYLIRSIKLVLTLLQAARQDLGAADDPARRPPPRQAPPRRAPLSPSSLLDELRRLVLYGQIGTMTGVIEALRVLEMVLSAWLRFPPGRGAERPLLLRLVEALSSSTVEVLEGELGKKPEGRRLWQIADLMLTIVRGSIRFGLVSDPRGFDAIDDYDFREWLEINGASRSTLDSAFVRAVAYDLIFAYEDGDPERPSTSAGQALRGGMRMLFTYRGALFWRMQAGMGDVVFAPFYEALEKRGVRFEFFHRLENVQLAEPSAEGTGRSHVAALEFDVQAEVRGGGAYRPLVDIHGLPCWPAEPDWAQLEGGAELARAGRDFESFWDRHRAGTKVLRVSEDFDFVVLGVSLGAVPHVCREIVERDPRWRRMVERVKTVNTQAAQIWMDPEMTELGWRGPSEVTLSGFVEPFDTWADMAHLLPREDWPSGAAPRSLAYFCSALPTPATPLERQDAEVPARRRAEVLQSFRRFLDRDVGALWPGAVGEDGRFRWEVLHGEAGEGEPRLEEQFWTANVNPTDRYVQTLPGTAKDRISPLDNTYDNLTIAGDWTACGHIAGCVEAAVMAGRLAAHAIARLPPLEDIVGFDHP